MKTITVKCGSIVSIFALIAGLCLCGPAVAAPPPQAGPDKTVSTAQGMDEETFMGTLAGKPRAEKLAAIRQYKIRQYERLKKMREEAHQTWQRKTEGNLQGRSGAARGIIENRLAIVDRNFNEMQEFIAGKHRENLTFIDKLQADPSLDGAALDKTVRDFFQAQKEAGQNRWQEYIQKRQEPMGR